MAVGTPSVSKRSRRADVCLAAIALGAHPRYPLVVAANRDEWHARAAAPAAWWVEGVLAGRDLVAGGTWLAATRKGRFALLTNVREPEQHDASRPSRGALVVAAATSAGSPVDVLWEVLEGGARFNGFNLVAGGRDRAAWGSNRADAPHELGAGVHALSNGPLDAPWPKVVRTRQALARWVASEDETLDPLFGALGDRGIAPDRELPSTGVTLEWERLLSSPFIVGERYGTRCSTVFAIDADGNARFVERTFDPAGRQVGEVDERFAVEA
jgi:uncharacterized protein with NRDE domain